MFQTLVSLVSILSLVYATIKDDLFVTMKRELGHSATVMPTNNVLSDITSIHSYDLNTADSDTLVAAIAKWNLPEDVSTQLAMAAYATTEEFQSYTFYMNPVHTYYEQYITAAKNVNMTITIAYMHAVVKAKLIQQYNTVSVRTCHKCWLVLTCCSSATAQIPRGVTSDEIKTMFSILKSTAYQSLLIDFPTQVFLHYNEILYPELI